MNSDEQKMNLLEAYEFDTGLAPKGISAVASWFEGLSEERKKQLQLSNIVLGLQELEIDPDNPPICSSCREEEELKKMSKTAQTISELAIIKRINRKLARDGEKLHKLLGNRGLDDVGRYYITNMRNNSVAPHCNLEELARELNVLGSHECIEYNGDTE